MNPLYKRLYVVIQHNLLLVTEINASNMKINVIPMAS